MNQKIKRIYAIISVAMLLVTMFVVPAFAADDPLAVVNNLSTFSAPVRSR